MYICSICSYEPLFRLKILLQRNSGNFAFQEIPAVIFPDESGMLPVHLYDALRICIPGPEIDRSIGTANDLKLYPGAFPRPALNVPARIMDAL